MYGPRTRPVSFSLTAEQYRDLERLAAAWGLSPRACARALCGQGLGSGQGLRVLVELRPDELAEAERLARAYGLDLSGLLAAVAKGLRQAPGFVAGHLLRGNEFRAGQGTGPAARG